MQSLARLVARRRSLVVPRAPFRQLFPGLEPHLPVGPHAPRVHILPGAATMSPAQQFSVRRQIKEPVRTSPSAPTAPGAENPYGLRKGNSGLSSVKRMYSQSGFKSAEVLKKRFCEMMAKFFSMLKTWCSSGLSCLKGMTARQVAVLKKACRDKSIDIYFSGVMLVMYCLFCRSVEKLERKLVQREKDSKDDCTASALDMWSRRVLLMVIWVVKYSLMVFSDSELDEVNAELDDLHKEVEQQKLVIDQLSNQLDEELPKVKSDLEQLKSVVEALEKKANK